MAGLPGERRGTGPRPPEAGKLAVLVVCAHAAHRGALVDLLAADPRLHLVGAASEGGDGLRAASRSGAAVVVVGHEVRGLHGPGLVRALAATGCAECAGVGATLSPRELRMLQMLAGGASYRSIGAHMGVPAATVRGYLAKLYAKLGTGDAASTVAEAVRRGWVAA